MTRSCLGFQSYCHSPNNIADKTQTTLAEFRNFEGVKPSLRSHLISFDTASNKNWLVISPEEWQKWHDRGGAILESCPVNYLSVVVIFMECEYHSKSAQFILRVV